MVQLCSRGEGHRGSPPSCPSQCCLEEREGDGKAPPPPPHFLLLTTILPFLSNALGECFGGTSCRWGERWASEAPRMLGVELPAGCKQCRHAQKHTSSVYPCQLFSLLRDRVLVGPCFTGPCDGEATGEWAFTSADAQPKGALHAAASQCSGWRTLAGFIQLKQTQNVQCGY